MYACVCVCLTPGKASRGVKLNAGAPLISALFIAPFITDTIYGLGTGGSSSAGVYPLM